MLTLLVVSLLVGTLLGLRFKVLILLPAVFAALLGILAVGISSGGLSSSALAMVIAATCLQLGYLIGSAGRYLSSAMRAGWLQRIWQHRATSAR
jgi:hypothetical protein